jgi:predicted molibdopterin-dependent oxidoreductase YjgC
MADCVRIEVNGRSITVAAGTTVAAALLGAGEFGFRVSVSGEPRAPLCGMGICMECRVTIDGVAHARSCQVVCRDGMSVRTA